MSNPVASVEIKARTGSLDAELSKARAKFHRFGDQVSEDFTRNGKKQKKGGGFFGGAMQTAVGQLAAGATSRLTSFVEDSAKSVYRFEDALVRLRIQADSTPEAMDAFGKSVRRASDATGMDREKILGAATAYVTLTGDMKTATESTATWAKVAQATNSSVEDIAKTAAAMTQNLKVTPAEMEEVFSTLAIQGKKGAIELKDLAGQMSSIAPLWAQFDKGTGARGVRELGAALQIVKRGFGGDAAETVTGMQSLLVSVSKFSGRFREGGAGSFFTVGADGTKHLKDVYTIVDQIGRSKLAKDPEKLQKAFGRQEAYRAYLQLKENKGALEELNTASQDATVIQKDFDTYMQSNAGKLSASWEAMKNAVADAFTPERIKGFVDAVQGLAGSIKPIVDGFSKVGGVLGDIYEAGKDLRQAVTGEGQITFMDEQLAKMGDQDAITKIDNVKGAEFYDRLVNYKGDKAALVGEYANALGESAVAKRGAAAMYLKENTTPTTFDKSNGGGMSPAVIEHLRQIKENTAAGTTVKVGGNAVAKASKAASVHRQGVAK